MTDIEAIEFLERKLGGRPAVAEALGVSRQVLNNWINEKRGISFAKRPVVWSKINDFGGNLSREWLTDRRPN